MRRLYEFGRYRLDVERRLLTHGAGVVTLAPKTLDLLILLIQSGGRVLGKRELMETLWPDTFVEEANLSFQISVLRKVLGQGGAQWIETLPKHGYRFTAEVNATAADDSPRPAPATSSRHVAIGVLASKKRLAGIAAMAALGVVSYAALVRQSRTEPMRTRSAVAVPLTAFPGFEDAPSLSPDGSQVAFSWSGPTQDNDDIYVKLVGPGEPLRLTSDPTREDNPSWSPDGRFIAFQRFVSDASADVFVIPALGGAERKIITIDVGSRGRWSESRLNTAGNLSWTPDGQWILFGGRPSPEEPAGIWVVAVNRSERRRLTNALSRTLGDYEPRLSHNGKYLAFVRERTWSASSLYVLPLSPDLTPAGEPVRVTPDNAIARGFAWMPGDDALVFSWGGKFGLSRLHKIALPRKHSDKIEQSEPLSFGEHASSISISATGRLVYSAQFRDTNIWRLALNGRQDGPSPIPRLASTFDEGTPDYSPDGKRLVFASTRSGVEEIWISNADGSNAAQVTTMGGPQCSNPRWSPDGRTIVFNSRSKGSADLYLLRPDTGEVHRITDDPAEELEPRWSRDGRRIYFGSNRTGRYEVWMMSASGGGAVRITRRGGLTATESSDGRFLYYAKDWPSPTSIWRVPVSGGDETQVVDGLSYPLNFVVADRGLYLVAVGDAPHKTSIDFFESTTGKRTPLISLGKQWWYGTALSPDQRWMLYSTVDNAGSNLMLVDNVRW